MSDVESREPLQDGKGGDKADNARSDTPYPYHSIREGERLVEAIAKAGGTEASEDDAMKAINLQSKSSRSWTYRLSTAIQFGLVQKTGRGEATRVFITSLGRMISMPESPDEVQVARMRAFLTPPLYQQLAKRYAGAPLPDAKGLANVLARDFAILPSVSEVAAEAFIESARHAGAVGSNGRLSANGGAVAAPAQAPAGDAPPQVIAPPATSIPGDAITHTYPLRKGVIISIQLPADLTAKDVGRI